MAEEINLMMCRKKKESITSGELAYTGDQVVELLRVIDDIQDRTLISLAIATGIRRGDIVKIERKNIDESDNSITFYQQKKKNFHKLFVSDSMMNNIRTLNKIRKSRWLFPGKIQGRHICSKSAYNTLRKYSRKAELPDIPFHALRATCIKLCQLKGWTPNETSRHVDDTLTTIERHYSVPSVQERQKTAQEKAVL